MEFGINVNKSVLFLHFFTLIEILVDPLPPAKNVTKLSVRRHLLSLPKISLQPSRLSLSFYILMSFRTKFHVSLQVPPDLSRPSSLER